MRTGSRSGNISSDFSAAQRTRVRNTAPEGRDVSRYAPYSRPQDSFPPGGSRKTSVGSGFVSVASKIWEKGKVFCIIAFVAILCLAAYGIDSALTSGRIYSGIHVGRIDVSGMTVSEAKDAIEETYSQKMFDTQVFVFASQEAMDELDVDMELLEQEALAEQISYEEAQSQRKVWLADAVTLGAELPADALASQAFAIGRDDGIFGRVNAALFGRNIEVKAEYSDVLLGSVVEEIEASAGEPMMDYGISITDGISSVTEGHDGYNVDRESFTASMDNYFFNENATDQKMVADIKFTPMRIGKDQADALSAAINRILPGGASFLYADASFDLGPEVLGDWIKTEIQPSGDGWSIIPSIDAQNATSSLVELVNSGSSGFDINVSIYQKDGRYLVQPDREITIPAVGSSLQQLDESLFGNYRKDGDTDTTDGRFNIRIEPELYSGNFELEDALSYGIVETFSSYTTNYNNTSSSANRTYNIHLAADLIDDSLVMANGGQWSFNDTAGDCNEESGFRAASTIMDGVLTDSIGGGVCQVATTVFNAVYDSGLPIVERHNHSLYISSYPDGRDAAVAFPSLDLIWENDTESDILLTTQYTDTSITVNLIGVSPGLTVVTEKGNWEEGDEYSIKVETDDTLAEGKSYTKTKGQDGRVIDVKRTVKDKDGNVVREKTFVSVYSPVNMVIAAGPGTDKEELIAKAEEAREKASGTDKKQSSSS